MTKPTYPIEIVNGIGLNHEQRLYVIQHPGGGFTCWGFENCFQEAKQLAEMMGIAGPSIEIHGTRECYDMNKELLEAYRVHPASKRTWYQIGTPVKVSRILEAARASYSDYGREGTILRLFYGDPETGRDWCEEFDTVGFLGRSSGTMKVPLILQPLLDDERNIVSSNCGGSINTTNILRIIDVRRAEELYRAKNYVLPHFEVLTLVGETEYRASVQRDGETVAKFRTYEDAASWVAFMQGFRVHQEFRTVREYEQELISVD